MALKDKKDISDIFKEKLGNYQANVDPTVWKGVSSAIGGGMASGGAAAFAKLSALTKVVAVTGVVSVAAVTAYFVVDNTNNKELEKTELLENKPLLLADSLTNDEIKSNDIEVEDNQTMVENVSSNEIENDNIEVVTSDLLKDNELVSVEDNPAKDTDVIYVVKHDLNDDKAKQDKNEKLENFVIPDPAAGKETLDEVDENVMIVPENIIINKIDNQHFTFQLDKDVDGRDVSWYINGNFALSGDIVEYIFEEGGQQNITAVIDFEQTTLEINESLEILIKGNISLLPNIFTPNNDGNSDLFFIESEGLINFTITIFDENRNIVFESNDPYFKWDGVNMYNYEKVHPGHYSYIIIATDELGNKINKYQSLRVVY